MKSFHNNMVSAFKVEIIRRDFSTKLVEIVDCVAGEFSTVEIAKTRGDELLKDSKYLCEADGYRVLGPDAVVDVTYRTDG